MRRPVFLLAAAFVLGAPVAFAQQAALAQHWQQANGVIEYSCSAGEALQLEGANNVLKLSGACGHLLIEGANNVIKAERLDSVSLDGANNQVTTRSGEAPRILKNVGTANLVSGPRANRR